jgi:hypothetical protein
MGSEIQRLTQVLAAEVYQPQAGLPSLGTEILTEKEPYLAIIKLNILTKAILFVRAVSNRD